MGNPLVSEESSRLRENVIDETMPEMNKKAVPGFQGFDDVESVCQYFHRKCLMGENSNEKCEEPLKECQTYGKMLLRGSYKLCMYMLVDSTECEVRQSQVINKMARDIHRGKVPFIIRSPARRSQN
ncbi:unnamed protein product, partial [Mesorhabditis belari]|uniref:Uncharacterized protein n=1 Tax=Mesorhabditis belari TaxID=2138241 RepID=A0AAF3F564_9BILA